MFCAEVFRKEDRDEGLDTIRRMVDSEIAQERLEFLASPPTLAIREWSTWGFGETEYLK